METRNAVERAVRTSYGRLLAYLSARSLDVASAEDALSEALQAALETWPRNGVPENPEAWLLVVARRRLTDAARHSHVQSGSFATLLAMADVVEPFALGQVIFPDERLKLLFICAHPAIDAKMRAPLMLQVVLGLDAARIGSAFLVKPSAMGQRLARAKAKIRIARIRFEVPHAEDLPARLAIVLEAVYAAYGSAWDDVSGADSQCRNLAAEAIELCELLLQLIPGEPEALGLLALMLHCEARREARRNSKGEYVALARQNTALWSASMIAAAEGYLSSAARVNSIGRFQLEAAIQSAHAHRILHGNADWEGVALLYEGLVRLSPTLGAVVGRAAAIAEARGAESGWENLQTVQSQDVKAYQPYWALAAHLLKRLGHYEEAGIAYGRAIALCKDAAVRAFLTQQAQDTIPSNANSQSLEAVCSDSISQHAHQESRS